MMLLLDLAAKRCPEGEGWEGWSKLSTLPRELKWSDVRCRFLCSHELDRSWEEELQEKRATGTFANGKIAGQQLDEHSWPSTEGQDTNSNLLG